ncbi:MAG: HEPN domain-containing protein [Candidatus Omnitrophota bacterium]|nr:HEPN domain-containing protein [Candidatus Omnitrophota bacterium]
MNEPAVSFDCCVEGYLNNFQCDNPSVFEGAPGVMLSPLSDEEKRELKNISAFHSGYSFAEWKLEISLSSVTGIGEADNKAEAIIQDVVTSLRLTKSGGVEIRTLRFRSDNLPPNISFLNNSGVTNPQPSYREGTYQCSGSDLEQTRNIYRKLQQAVSSRLRIGIGRFNTAYLDYRDEDKLIDNITALEALLLRESQELSLRLSLRCACLLRKGDERKTLFEFVKEAYSWRNKLIHGGQYNLPDELVVGQTKFNKHSFLVFLQQVVRDCIKLSLMNSEMVDKKNLENLNPF